jgi:CubicO group peptidase (beta-lactamase class C family)
VCGQVHDENAYFMGGVAGHAGVFSTAHDLALLVQALLDALAGTGHLLSPTTVARFVTRANLVEGSSWAFGWDTPSVPSSSGKLFSELSFGHTGFTGTSIWVDRQRGLVVILLTNRVHPTRGSERISQFRPYFHDLVVSLVADH